MKNGKKILAFILAVMLFISPVSVISYAVSESDMKSKVVSVAQNEVGYEGTGSYSKYGEWYGYQGAWCTTFALWCFNKAGESLGVKLYANIVPSGGNCNSMISWYQNRGRYHKRDSDYSPKKGDLVFFDWSSNGSSQHVGIVKSVSGSTIKTIEGNCSGKVKEKTYTPSGSKPYANISSIMGYGAPDWASVASGSSAHKTTKKKTTKKQTTTKKKTTAKKQTTKKQTTKQNTTKNKTTKKAETASQTTETTKTTTTETTKPAVLPKDMKLHAATTELQIGDSVKLEYSIEPNNANAVIGYFCDEENIIEIKKGGVIKATGEGVATVVVCANDEIYRQMDFTVSSVSSQVTKHTPDTPLDTFEPSSQIADKDLNQKLRNIGIDAEKLEAHYKYYIIPLYIIGFTALLSFAILAVKRIAKAIRNKKEKNSID